MSSNGTATLYGSPLSLYTGRARSYLIKAGISYREQTPTTPHYRDVVLPKAGGRQGVPTLELADGTVIRDGAAIIDHFEAENGHAFSPTSPRQRVLSALFDVIGAEGLLRPAMHYRWNFPEHNLAFLQYHFETMAPPVPQRAEMAGKMMDRMRDACRGFGAVEDTFALVEELYEALLTALDNHFSAQPYLLGGRPSVGDFGMIAPLYAHLGRDPKPLSMMQARAIRLFRWVERMNRPEADTGEFAEAADIYLNDDDVPPTLIALLRQLSVDFVPETEAAADSINAWIDTQSELAPGTTAERIVSFASFEVQGATVNAVAQPYRFYLLQRVQDIYDSLGKEDQNAVSAMLTACGMAPILDCRLSRRISRANNLEVWV